MTSAKSSPDVLVPDSGTRPEIEPRKLTPIKWWGATGAAILGLALYVLVRWLLSGPEPAPIGRLPVPGKMRAAAMIGQTLVPAAALMVIWRLVIQPWRRNRRASFDALFILAIPTVYWLDPLLNYTQTFFTYNATLINLGSWAMQIPGWVAPNNEKLAEPIVMMPFAYVLWFFGGTVLVNSFMRKVQTRRPQTSTAGLIGFCLLFLFVLDTMVELVFMTSGLYSYPGAFWATFPGHYYQFPVLQSLFMTAAWTPWACLRYFRNERGESIAERGIDSLRVGSKARTGLRFLAIAGVLQAAAIVFYILPAQFMAINAHSFPKDILQRPYLMTGLCGEGTDYACPGEDTPITRRGSRHIAPDGSVHPGA